MAHIFVFGRKALGLLNDIKEGRPEGEVTESLRVWLRMNAFRGVVTDFVAWGCFVGAVIFGGV